jgi:hypothetical protein
MPDRNDFSKSRRPPPRKTWEDTDEFESDDDGLPPSKSRSNPYASQTNNRLSRGGQTGSPGEVGQNRRPEEPIQSLSSGWGKKSSMTEEEKAELSKKNNKRLFKMLGNQALCLAIIFGMISAFNWMATDYSGDYMGQNRQLRTVRLTITRRAASADAELTYGDMGVLDLDASKDQPSPRGDKEVSLDFATPEKFRQNGERVWRANFTGRIDGTEAVGVLTDSTGEYNVKMEKNVFTSLFNQLSAHIPRLPSVPVPTFFNERTAKPVHGQFNH